MKKADRKKAIVDRKLWGPGRAARSTYNGYILADSQTRAAFEAGRKGYKLQLDPKEWRP